MGNLNVIENNYNFMQLGIREFRFLAHMLN